MRLLLDTHIVIWAVLGSPRLSSQARSLIADPENKVFVSVASIWEIAIKRALGRRDAVTVPISEFRRFLDEAGYAILNITAAHAEAVEHLPPLHGDPFDRLLVAQASVEPLVLLTHDPVVSRYSGTIVRV